LAAPEEDDFVYQVRRPQPAVDPAVRRIAFLAGGVSVGVILVALLWSGVRGSGFGPPPVILPPPGPLRVLPSSPGGLTVPEADQQIMSGNPDADSGPPPELAPAGPGAAISQLNQAAGSVLPPGTGTSTANGAGVAPVSGSAGDAAGVLASGMPAAGAAAAAAAAGGGSDLAGSGAGAAGAAGAAGGAASDLAAAAGQNKTVEVQLAATTDQAGAQSVWGHLRAKVPSLLKGRTPSYVPALVNGKNVVRLRVGGFADTAGAEEFCAAMNAHGAACTVAAF
jgi:hypothetical protein